MEYYYSMQIHMLNGTWYETARTEAIYMAESWFQLNSKYHYSRPVQVLEVSRKTGISHVILSSEGNSI